MLWRFFHVLFLIATGGLPFLNACFKIYTYISEENLSFNKNNLQAYKIEKVLIG